MGLGAATGGSSDEVCWVADADEFSVAGVASFGCCLVSPSIASVLPFATGVGVLLVGRSTRLITSGRGTLTKSKAQISVMNSSRTPYLEGLGAESGLSGLGMDGPLADVRLADAVVLSRRSVAGRMGSEDGTGVGVEVAFG
jgi:hypothetical protein